MSEPKNVNDLPDLIELENHPAGQDKPKPKPEPKPKPKVKSPAAFYMPPLPEPDPAFSAVQARIADEMSRQMLQSLGRDMWGDIGPAVASAPPPSQRLADYERAAMIGHEALVMIEGAYSYGSRLTPREAGELASRARREIESILSRPSDSFVVPPRRK